MLELSEHKAAIKALWTKDMKLIERYFRCCGDHMYVSINNAAMTCEIFMLGASNEIDSVLIRSRIPIEVCEGRDFELDHREGVIKLAQKPDAFWLNINRTNFIIENFEYEVKRSIDGRLFWSKKGVPK